MYREESMLKGIMKTAEAEVRLSPDEVLELSRLLTPIQCDMIVLEGESVLIRADDDREGWREYWLGR